MLSSGTLCRVTLVTTDVSEERIAFIIRVSGIGELGTLAVPSNRSTLGRNTKREKALVCDTRGKVGKG
jgi:hypothetical protein